MGPCRYRKGGRIYFMNTCLNVHLLFHVPVLVIFNVCLMLTNAHLSSYHMIYQDRFRIYLFRPAKLESLSSFHVFSSHGNSENHNYTPSQTTKEHVASLIAQSILRTHLMFIFVHRVALQLSQQFVISRNFLIETLEERL